MQTYKLLLIVLLCNLYSRIYSQNNSIDIRIKIDSAFMELDLQYIPTGILDKSIAVTPKIRYYKPINDTITNFITWKSIYKSMRFGSFNTAGFISDDSVKSLLVHNRAQDVIPVFILNFDYNQFKYYAVDSNLISTNNNQFFDVTEREESPYLEKTIFNASAAFGLSYSSNAKFVFNEEYYFTNNAIEIDSIKCDFADGIGFRKVNWGDTIIINYSNLDTNTITLKMYAGLKLFESTFEFKMADICPDPEEYPNDIIADITATIPYPDDETETEAYGIAKYTLTYGNSGGMKHTEIKKPLIFLPELDPGYANYITNTDDCKYGMNGWIDIAYEQIFDLERGFAYPWTPEFDFALDFFQSLWDAGYDVIYFDYKSGDDYMQRNAFALVELLTWVNANKSSDAEETVIIGASMGGQIARYALTYMESNNILHCTRLFIPFDSGAKGSNLPLGLQHFGLFAYNATAEDSPEYDNLQFQFQALLRPASEQLLVPHIQGTEPDKSHIERTNFYTELFSLDADGYPNNLRKVAVANGNKTGTSQDGIEPGDILVDLYQQIAGVTVDAPFIGTFTAYLGEVNATAWFLPSD